MEQSLVSRPPRKVDMVVAGEHLRCRLHCEQPPLIKDRRYHLRVYQSCFVARDLVDWLIEHLEANDRNAAVECMEILLCNGFVHHVCDDHQFKDQMLFYRFRRDDGTEFPDKETEILYKGLDLYHRILSDQKQFVLQDIMSKGRLFKTCFVARRLVDWITVNGEAHLREDAVEVGVTLLHSGLIKQLSSGNNFQDDDVYYQFTVEDIKSLKLMDVLTLKGSVTKQNPNTEVRPTTESDNTHDATKRLKMSKFQEMDRRRQSSIETPPNTPPSPTEDRPLSPRPVIVRKVSVEELEDKKNPYVMTKIAVLRDAVGYGFVVRGSMPVYVQTVDPNGPGAAAGIKVRQYIYSVNGKNVLRWSHQQVAEEIFNSPRVIDLVVMNHFRGS